MRSLTRRDVLRLTGTAAALGVVGSQLGPASQTEAQAAACLTFYDNTVYDKVGNVKGDAENVGKILGIQKSGIVYTGTWDSYFAAGDPPPDDGQYEAAVATAAITPGPIVINAETIFLKANIDENTANARRDIWINLLDRARAVAPSRKFGGYAFPENTAEQYRAKAAVPVSKMDAFFPSFYRSSQASNDSWVTTATIWIQRCAALDSSKPRYLYYWPSYADSPHNSVDSDDWQYQLNWAGRDNHCVGVVIWSSSVAGTDITDNSWLDKTANYIATCS